MTGLPPAATPEEQAAREAQIAELNAQITEQQAAVTAAEEAAAQAQAAADEAAEDTDETALQTALELMANKPVDDDVMEWAKEVLGFGEEVGKIDEVREVLEFRSTLSATSCLNEICPDRTVRGQIAGAPSRHSSTSLESRCPSKRCCPKAFWQETEP